MRHQQGSQGSLNPLNDRAWANLAGWLHGTRGDHRQEVLHDSTWLQKNQQNGKCICICNNAKAQVHIVLLTPTCPHQPGEAKPRVFGLGMWQGAAVVELQQEFLCSSIAKAGLTLQTSQAALREEHNRARIGVIHQGYKNDSTIRHIRQKSSATMPKAAGTFGSVSGRRARLPKSSSKGIAENYEVCVPQQKAPEWEKLGRSG